MAQYKLLIAAIALTDGASNMILETELEHDGIENITDLSIVAANAFAEKLEPVYDDQTMAVTPAPNNDLTGF